MDGSDELEQPPDGIPAQPRGRGRKRQSSTGWLSQVLGFWGVGVAPAIAMLVIWLIGGTAGYIFIEGMSLLDALYMTVITLSTVGYEEIGNLSTEGRIFTLALIGGGLGTVFYAFTRIGQLVIEGELVDILGRRRMRSELEALQDHWIVCGYSRTSEPVVEGLEQEGEAFCVVDIDPEQAAELEEQGFVYHIGDAIDEQTLQTVGIERAKGLLALLPSDADNLYLTMTAKNANPAVRVIARSTDEKAELNLRRGGADEVVSPYKTAGTRVLQAAIKPAVVEFMELATPRLNIQLSLEEVLVEPDSLLDGRSLAEAEIRRRCGAIIVAIRHGEAEMSFNPHPSEEIQAGDTLVALGEAEDLAKLEELCEA